MAPSLVTVVELEEERGGGDLAELLARSAGLQLRRYGGLGAQAVPSLRGSSGAQVQLLIDGLPLADAQSGAVDLSLLPLERYESAEIHRGLVPVGFGGIGAAGAVNLQSRERTSGFETRLFAGSFGDRGGRVSLGGASGGGGASMGDASRGGPSASSGRRGLLLIHGRRIDNDFTYRDHNQTFQTTTDDTVRRRANADFEEWGVYGLGELAGGAGRVRTALGWFRRLGGRPGPLGFPSPDARIRLDRLDGRITLANAGGTLVADAAASRREEWLFDEAGQVGWDPPGNTQAVSEDVVGRLSWNPGWRLEEIAGWLPAGDLDLLAGGDGRLEWYRETFRSEERPLRRRRTVSTFAGATLELAALRLALNPSWRWQRFEDDFPPVPPLPWLPEEEAVEHVQDAVSPALGVSWEAVPRALFLEVHWHETVRQPNWVELFGQPGGLEGNRELVPETIRGRDVSVKLANRDLGATLRVTGFIQRTDRTIIWRRTSLATSRAENVGSTHTAGVELETVVRRGPLSLSGAATWQKARDRGADPVYYDKALPYLSDWDVFATAAWRAGRWTPSAGVVFQSPNYRDRYNQEVHRAPQRMLLNLSLAHAWSDGLAGIGHETVLTCELLNVTDNDVYDVEGYPLPGRSVRLSLYWR
jgi:iron complex outermembrane receptor protein